MKAHFAQTNRLGNRESNQDRLNIFETRDCVLLVLADGMGGHKGGEIAAEITLETLEKHFRSATKPLSSPRAFLEIAMEAAHNNIHQASKFKVGSFEPRTTCIACLLQNNNAYWAHVGDSRLYLLRHGHMIMRTQDHSYVEDLRQQGQISEQEMLKHPMRNYLTECLGGDRGRPNIAFGEYHELEANDVLLLCSDGFWSQLQQQQLYSISNAGDIDARLDELADLAERQYYPQSDNISAIVARWLEQQPATTGKINKPATAGSKHAKRSDDAAVDDAIDAITSALEQYENELKH